MTNFSYKAMEKGGGLKLGQVESNTKNDAYRMLTEQGLTPFELIPAAAKPLTTPFKAKQFARFARGIGQLLNAGLDIDSALTLMARSETRATMKTKIEELRGAVLSGASISEAIQSTTFNVPDYVPGLLRAGENSAQLADTWIQVALIEEKQLKSRQDIRSALLYPAFLLSVAMASIVLILLVVAPALKPILSATDTPPGEVQALLATSDWLAANWTRVLLVALVILLTSLIWARSDSGRHQRDAIVEQIPWIGRLVRSRDAARFLSACALMIKAGMPLPDVLKAASQATSNLSIRKRLEPLSREVRDGRSLSASGDELKALPDEAVRLIAIGEETGKLAEMMTQASASLDMQADQLQRTVTSLLAPILTLVLGLIVGGVVLTMLTAILSVNDVSL